MTSESRMNMTTEELIEEIKAKGISAEDILKLFFNAKKTQSKQLEVYVTEILKDLGIPANIKGYRYIRRAIIIAHEKPSVSITKELYPSIAREFETTASRVERAIRHAIDVSWVRGNSDTINEIFGRSISGDKGKPTNSEFILQIADKIYLESN